VHPYITELIAAQRAADMRAAAAAHRLARAAQADHGASRRLGTHLALLLPVQRGGANAARPKPARQAGAVGSCEAVLAPFAATTNDSDSEVLCNVGR
jgi:hypothetical protein